MTDVGVCSAGLGLLNLHEIVKPLPAGYQSGVDPKLLSTKMVYNFKPNNPPQKCEQFASLESKRNTLLNKLKETLPNLSQEVSYRNSLESIVNATKVKTDAISKRDVLSKTKPVDQDALKEANSVVANAEQEIEKRLSEAAIVAGEVLKRPDVKVLQSSDFDDSDLIAYTIIQQATPQKLAQWCDQGPEQTRQILEFLDDTTLMRSFLQSGGARHNEYGRAVQIYHQINPNPSNAVLQRLRLAVALELCSPYTLFDSKETVQPLQRYVHYEQAYLLGELDACFSQFNVWEMRHIVNSDVTEEELAWGRKSLLNYRPDLVHSDSSQWRYCLIVKTDVAYATPDWYKPKKTFDQILSGGGKCGPRAWYGRFICKAFGIPTWGVKQPGHAAMTRWTKDGWCTCLGAGFQYSFWEEQHGLYFLVTTQAMRVAGSEAEYTTKVKRLEWVASFYQENSKFVVSHYQPHYQSLWWSLSYFQRKMMAATFSSTCKVFMYPRIDVSPNIQEQVKIRKIVVDTIYKREYDGVIIIPANSCVQHPKKSNKVILTQCYEEEQNGGGRHQLFIKENGTVDYILNVSDLITTTQQQQIVKQQYNLICRVCTVHRKSKPISVVLGTDNKTLNKPISIDLPYTVGLWNDTKPVIVELGGAGVTTNLIRITRENEPYGFSLQEIRLIPV